MVFFAKIPGPTLESFSVDNDQRDLADRNGLAGHNSFSGFNDVRRYLFTLYQVVISAAPWTMRLTRVISRKVTTDPLRGATRVFSLRDEPLRSRKPSANLRSCLRATVGVHPIRQTAPVVRRDPRARRCDATSPLH
jgi:hypothetical protein